MLQSKFIRSCQKKHLNNSKGNISNYRCSIASWVLNLFRIFQNHAHLKYLSHDCHGVNYKANSGLFQVNFTEMLFYLFKAFKFIITSFWKICRLFETVFFFLLLNLNADHILIKYILFDKHFLIVFSVDRVMNISVWLIVGAEILTGPWESILQLKSHSWFFSAIIRLHQL